jgi:CHAT domain-containing protein
MDQKDESSAISKNYVIWHLLLAGKQMESKQQMDEAKNVVNFAREVYSKPWNKAQEAACWEQVCTVYWNGCEYGKCIKALNTAIFIYKQLSGKERQLAHCLVKLGTTYNSLGKYDEAMAQLEEAIEMSSRVGDEIVLGMAYTIKGETYIIQGKLEEAMSFFQKGLEISEKTGNEPDKARNLHNMGNTYFLQRKLKEAIDYCEKSVRIHTGIGDKKSVALSYSIIAISYGWLGETDIAEHYFKMSKDIGCELFPPIDLSIGGNKALMYYYISLSKFLSKILFPNSDDPRESLEICVASSKLAMESSDEILACLSVDSNKTSFVDQYYYSYDFLTWPFNLLGRSTASLLFLDLGRAKILRHLVYKQVENQEEDNGNSSFQSSWLTIENGKEKEIIFNLAREIQLLESNATVLFYNFNCAEILTIWVLDANGCVSLKTSDPQILSTSRKELKSHIKTLLEKASVVFPRGYSFFKPSTVINFEDENAKESTSSLSEEKAEEEMSRGAMKAENVEMESEYRAPCKKADVSCNDLAKDTRLHLHKALIDPVKDLIKGTKLIIVPHDCLFLAPFSSFIDEIDCPLSEKYEIQIVPSLHVLAISMQAGTSKKIGGSLFVGNPEVKDTRLPSLPSAQEEVEFLASLLDAKPVTGSMATKHKVLNLMPNASIIHIAAHGHEQSGHIFLAPESGKPNDGAHPILSSDLLTQSDVLGCKLSARLVVLSCCHSGTGKLSSEGVLGIARSFLGAGANSVLVTLWKINDRFTKEFMKVFYEKICDEKSVCLALKETMNKFQRSKEYSSFLFWSAYEIMGEDVRFTKSEIEEIRRNNKI